MRVALVSLWVSLATAYALNPLVIKGHKFFDSVTKEQVFIKGVAYQPRNEVSTKSPIADPLADASACARDAPLMAKLGANVVRVYEVDPTKNHDACMKSFLDAGIYLLLDIATPKFSVNRKSPEYGIRLYNAYKASVDAFSKYDNTMAFIAGNEVTNDRTNTQASAFVKAAIRDVKHYIRNTKRRYIPVGYASNDDEYIRDAIKDYFNCGDEESQADFFGVNLYEWCGGSSFEKSGYADRTKEFASYSKPVFLSEYGCNLVTPRLFTEVESIYGPDMTDVWSGGVVYEWTQENNRYGLVKIDSTTNKAEILEDYTNLKNELAKIKPVGVKMDDFNEQRPASECPQKSNNWRAAVTLPPTPSEGACNCMLDNLSCRVSDSLLSLDGSSSGKTKQGSSPVGNQIDLLCGMVSCADISTNAEEGKYGAFSFCPPSDKLSWLYNLYIKNNRNGKCDFDGNANLVSPKRSDLDTCANIEANMDGPDASDPNRRNFSPVMHDTSRALMALALGSSYAFLA